LELTDLYGDKFLKEIIEKKDGVITYSWRNEDDQKYREKLVSFMYYPVLDWYISSGYYLDELYEPFDKLLRKIYLMTLILIPVSFMTTYIYSRLIIKPLKDVSYRMYLISKKEEWNTIKSNRHDEIGDLIRIFNKMGSTIKDKISLLEKKNMELYNVKNNLEEEVELRTKELQDLSEHDALTGLYNRRKLNELLVSYWQNPVKSLGSLSVIMIDIDHFKLYNDTFGHLNGDICLKNVADIIKSKLKRNSDIAFRYGGEEFLILLPNSNDEISYHISEEIRKSIEEISQQHDELKLSSLLTISAGVYTMNTNENCSMKELLMRADNALYYSKNSGRNMTSLYKNIMA